MSAPLQLSVFLNESGTAVPFNINDGLAGLRREYCALARQKDADEAWQQAAANLLMIHGRGNGGLWPPFYLRTPMR